MDTLGTFVLLLVAVIGVVVLLASRKPDTFRVERRATIKTPAEAVFAQINTMRAWEGWSPWQAKDPSMSRVYSGPEAGTGASQSWDGNSKVGKGSMTITQSTAPSHVAFRLDFEKPFKATNISEFTFKPVTGGTEVVWAMHGPANLMSKVMDLIMNMDRMIGRDFEQGLQTLKTRCEG